MSDEKPSDIARNIWLAGLGAYGKALRDAQGKLEEAAKEPPRLFKELVEKGTKLDTEVRDSLANIRKSGHMSVEERINRVRETFNLNLGRGDELAEIHEKLDALTKRVEELADRLEGRKPAAKKARAKKAPAKKAARKKTSRKQPAARKSAPRARKKSPAR
jgi:polyhydroxyalkanoate synthesis regulator phasin